MEFIWFLAGVLTTLAALVAILPWLRKMPRFQSLPFIPWQASVSATVVVIALVVLARSLGHPDAGHRAALAAPSAPENAPSAFSTAAKTFASSAGDAADLAAAKPSAGSMNGAIANLEARLAKGGGTDGDWELLAKSFEFLGRPADAAKARARQLPPLPMDGDSAGAVPAQASGTAVSGVVTLAPALESKAAGGEILFIVAKSVDSPGIPVAVLRLSVGRWPLKFTLDDSQSMVPGRNLSSAGRVTIEARISQKGQPLPAPGDLQGATGVINPGDHRPLKITIDRVIS